MDRELLPPDTDPEIVQALTVRESQEHDMIAKRAGGWSYARIAKYMERSPAWVERKFREEHIAKELKIAADAIREAVQNQFAMLGRKAAETLEEIMTDTEQPGKVRVEAAKEVRNGIVELSSKADKHAPREDGKQTNNFQFNIYGSGESPDHRNVKAVADSLRKKRHG